LNSFLLSFFFSLLTCWTIKLLLVSNVLFMVLIVAKWIWWIYKILTRKLSRWPLLIRVFNFACTKRLWDCCICACKMIAYDLWCSQTWAWSNFLPIFWSLESGWFCGFLLVWVLFLRVLNHDYGVTMFLYNPIYIYISMFIFQF